MACSATQGEFLSLSLDFTMIKLLYFLAFGSEKTDEMERRV